MKCKPVTPVQTRVSSTQREKLVEIKGMKPNDPTKSLLEEPKSKKVM